MKLTPLSTISVLDIYIYRRVAHNMVSYILPICLFIAALTIVSAVPADQTPFDCPENERYIKCDLEVCFKTCDHLKNFPPCPSIAAGCFKPACLCKDGYLRNAEGKCVPTDQCNDNRLPVAD
ncbi:hypothetical protein HW555_012055 [Spodoptera exigua]|uniref:TIL domain-containing protein n=1 Tax=Spodoptera exigua TaxID=7107 RepID=A0A835G5S9_SPOEX|nr:hypothetical protein HW555_012055 [Spodoptera exigua]